MNAIRLAILSLDLLLILGASFYNIIFLKRVQHVEENINIEPPLITERITRYILIVSVVTLAFIAFLLLNIK